jgi:hypothetical protein
MASFRTAFGGMTAAMGAVRRRVEVCGACQQRHTIAGSNWNWRAICEDAMKALPEMTVENRQANCRLGGPLFACDHRATGDAGTFLRARRQASEFCVFYMPHAIRIGAVGSTVDSVCPPPAAARQPGWNPHPDCRATASRRDFVALLSDASNSHFDDLLWRLANWGLESEGVEEGVP